MIDFLSTNLAIILFFLAGTALLVVEVFMPGVWRCRNFGHCAGGRQYRADAD